jgi:hypothetical protein
MRPESSCAAVANFRLRPLMLTCAAIVDLRLRLLTGWVKLGAFLPHTGWSSLAPSCCTWGGSTASHGPPHPSEFPAPDPRKEKPIQLHPPLEEPLKMMDLRNHTYQMIKGHRCVPENQWWDKTKDKRVEPRFRNVIQQTFLLQLQIPAYETVPTQGYKLGSYEVGRRRGC